MTLYIECRRHFLPARELLHEGTGDRVLTGYVEVRAPCSIALAVRTACNPEHNLATLLLPKAKSSTPETC